MPTVKKITPKKKVTHKKKPVKKVTPKRKPIKKVATTVSCVLTKPPTSFRFEVTQRAAGAAAARSPWPQNAAIA